MWLGMLSDVACYENHWDYVSPLSLSPTELRLLRIDLFLVTVNIAMRVGNAKRMKKGKRRTMRGVWSLVKAVSKWDFFALPVWPLENLLTSTTKPDAATVPMPVLVAVIIQLLSKLLPAHMTASASWPYVWPAASSVWWLLLRLELLRQQEQEEEAGQHCVYFPLWPPALLPKR